MSADRLFEDVKCDRSAVDALIVVTSSPDYHYPATACILQHRLGLSEECSCFDLGGLACSAYVHGMWLAHSLVESGAARHCLVLAGDILMGFVIYPVNQALLQLELIVEAGKLEVLNYKTLRQPVK